MSLILSQGFGAHDRSFPISLLAYPQTASPTFARSTPQAFPSPVSDMMPQPPLPPPPPPPGSSRRPEELAPIDENEWVYLLSEIIRQARERPQSPLHVKPASSVLYDYIHQNGIKPSWEDIALPGGRSLRSYQYAYEQFHSAGPGALYPIYPPLKRSLPVDQYTPLGRQLMPKPSIGPAAPARMVPGPIHPTPLSPLGGPHLSAEPRKKRGRPSKKEQEERRLRLSESRIDSSQLGTILPSPGGLASAIQAGPSGEVPPSPATSAPLHPGTFASTPRAASHPLSSNNSSSSSRKKRGRPPKNPGPVIPPPQFGVGERSEAYGTPPQTAAREDPRESERSSREPPNVSSAPPESSQRLAQAEPEETKPGSGWRDMILNE